MDIVFHPGFIVDLSGEYKEMRLYFWQNSKLSFKIPAP